MQTAPRIEPGGHDRREHGRRSSHCLHLTPGELAGRREALLPGLAARAQRVARAEHGYRLVFAPAPELLRAIADVVEAERHCCQFLRFELTVEAGLGAVSLTVTGPAGTQEMLAGLLAQ